MSKAKVNDEVLNDENQAVAEGAAGFYKRANDEAELSIMEWHDENPEQVVDENLNEE